MISRSIKVFMGLLFTLVLTGCIGESYDFNPPAVELSGDRMIGPQELEQGAIDWRGENNEPVKKEETDMKSIADGQQPMNFGTGEKAELLFSHADFDTEELSVSLWQNGTQTALDVNDISFTMPDDPGEYMLEVNLRTDRGNVQYIGKVVIS
ncbi:hypothetical protein [Edaphobacillus lindanitolerans]|uniref:Uncharacterized protein n=1 Tax=Edaphobacillus lindanitolerans TaxID=550447 RepID=A0A1U7PS70_9BACI|nr:hypothetical protein [Edaphobacillus lindanitolerans]SIT88391.1 hypothetical protein SAMN05428946_2267 [Edaphobacillus lindanitolerans]